MAGLARNRPPRLGICFVFNAILHILFVFNASVAGQGLTTEEPLDYNSCAERCVESYFPGRPCYCNVDCVQFGNCCDDFYAICRPDLIRTEDWVDFGGHSYKFFEGSSLTQGRALSACRQHGGLLVSINSPDEQEFVRTRVFQGRTVAAYSGGTDQRQEGEWQWMDGTMVNTPTDRWHFWYPGQPDSVGVNDDCVVLSNYKFWVKHPVALPNFFWIDFSCDIADQDVQGYVCERTLACDPNPCQFNGSCFYVGGDEKFSCECIQGYVGVYCEIPLVEGEEWTRCGPTELTAPSGALTTPLYPRAYPPNARCTWVVSVGAGSTIAFRLESFAVERSKACAFDSFSILDGTASGPSLLNPSCGMLNDTDNLKLGLPLVTSGPTAVIKFNSDETVQESGFRLTYKADTCGRGVGVSGCGTPRTFTTDCGRVEVKRGPPEEDICQWALSVRTGYVINVTFTHFDIPDTGSTCGGTSLVVYDGPQPTFSALERACGRRFVWSVISSSNRVLLQLQDSDWNDNMHGITFEYSSIDPAEWRRVRRLPVEEGVSGTLEAGPSSVYVETATSKVHTWLLQTPVGTKLTLNWTLHAEGPAQLQIFDGHSEHSTRVVDLSTGSGNRSGQMTATNFRVLIKATADRRDQRFRFRVDYKAKDWLPTLSGCYRPLYSSSTNSLGTENSLVLPDQPVVLMVSDTAYSQTNPGYDQGLYCKWTIRAEKGSRLKLSFLDFDVPQNEPNCYSDGLVVRDTTAGTASGPFCGASSSVKTKTVTSSSETLDVYFYSDNRGSRRAGGKVRALVTVDARTSCEFLQMETSSSPALTTSCGVLLSPWFPGLVPPQLWSWTLVPHPEKYLILNIHYVRGPGLSGECNQYFQVIERAEDSTTLRQVELILFKLCGDTTLFIPRKQLKVPPREKVALELNTILSTFYQRWEFKISYSSEIMAQPNHTSGPPGACPENYAYYRGYCYLYEPWVNRHYRPSEYTYMTTWQGASERCSKDNASLLSIMDEEEADFIMYRLSHEWFWNPIGVWQANHRSIYIGLTNTYGDYKWVDGVMQVYADWYQPPSPTDQPVVHETEPEKYDALGGLAAAEPKADLASLCTITLLTSPFGSMNWAKLPCDYPIFRAGLICKKPSLSTGVGESNPTPYTEVLKRNQLDGYRGCASGWFFIRGRCFSLHTDYDKIVVAKERYSNMDPLPDGIPYTEAEGLCSEKGGTMAELQEADMEQLRIYLTMWRHSDYMGNIWLRRDGDQCQLIQLNKSHRLSETTNYNIRTDPCSTLFPDPQAYNTLCQRDSTVLMEACTSDEFQCGNGVCISVDFVCDGQDDCFDNSDEKMCPGDTCAMDKFRCDNGRCISMAFFCDLFDNCGDGSDEAKCVREQCGRDQFQCGQGQCIPKSGLCDLKVDCVDGTDEVDSICAGQCSGFQCFSGRCLAPFLRHDSISDCPGLAQEDEIDQSRDLNTFFEVLEGGGLAVEGNVTISRCPGTDYAQCLPGYDACFRRSQACIYDTRLADDTDARYVTDSCRDGSHLRRACGELECPGFFKCPSSYCVPYSKVCDGQKDCPRGEDEAQCTNYTCPGLLHCKQESFCLPHDKLCDGQVDCPKYKEDEKYCGLTDILCKSTCDCKGNVAFCSNMSVSTLPTDNEKTRTLRALLLSHNPDLSITNDSFIGLHWLGKLDLSYNSLNQIPEYSFVDLKNLRELDLSNNEILELDSNVFKGLISLYLLNLDNNNLVYIDRFTFAHLSSIGHLIITGNILTDVTQDAFDEVQTLTNLRTDAFRFCCIAKHVQSCFPKPDEFSSCEDLMANGALQISIWILGFFAFAGNIFVVAWRVKTDRSKVSSFFIINLGCSDFLMGVYMLIIASVDAYYRGQYIVYADKWRSSALCQIAGILAMTSSELSVFMLTVITGDRIFAILFPLKKGNFRLVHARYIVLGGWIVCIFLSILPALGIPYFGKAFFGKTGVCLPFQMNNEQGPGWEFSVFIFLVVNFISFLFIFIGYVAIFMSVKSSAEKMGDNSTSATNELALAKKLMLIVVTDFLCWVPIIFIGFASLGGVPIPAQVSALVAVFVLPLNSAVNPILYTMSALDCSSGKKKKKKMPASGSSVPSTAVTSVKNGASEGRDKQTSKI